MTVCLGWQRRAQAFSQRRNDVSWGVDASGVATWVATGVGSINAITGAYVAEAKSRIFSKWEGMDTGSFNQHNLNSKRDGFSTTGRRCDDIWGR